MLPAFILTNSSGICWLHLCVSTDYTTTIREVCISWIHFLCMHSCISVKSQVDMRSIVIQLDLRELIVRNPLGLRLMGALA